MPSARWRKSTGESSPIATAQNIVDSIQLHVRDTAASEISEANILILINDAAQEASASQWYLHIEDDETLTLTSGDHEYNVPAGFVAIKELRLGTNWDVIIAPHYWRLGMNGTVPVFYFEPSWENVYTAGSMKVVGYKRPTTAYTLSPTTTIDPGLEAFLRDRAAAHVLAFMAAGTSELDRYRAQASEIKKRDSELLLERRSQQFTIIPTARYVPSR